MSCDPSLSMFLFQKELADALADVGAVQSALELYQRLGMWNRVIECYQAAGRHSQAEQVVKERMKIEGESPLLLCLLGDTMQVRAPSSRFASSVLHHLMTDLLLRM